MSWQRKYHSKIKDLYFEIPNFKYFHGPTKVDEGEQDFKFFGREVVIEKIKGLIGDSLHSTGAYLVTGFRGMGKTSVVNQALKEVKDKNKEADYNEQLTYCVIELSLAQDDLSDHEILKQLSFKIYNEYERPDYSRHWWYALKVIIIEIITIALFIGLYIGIIDTLKKAVTQFGDSGVLTLFTKGVTLLKAINDVSVILPLLLFVAICYIIFKLLKYVINNYILRALDFPTDYLIKKRLRKLLTRIQSKVTEHQNQIQGNWGNLNPLRRSLREYPFATAKDIEGELIAIFRIAKAASNKWSGFNILTGCKKRRFVFVFDELDKIDPNSSISLIDKAAEDPYAQMFGSESLTRRQEAINKLLGNLKHFLNTADAKFIFIAGREMFDASLADVSDRDSFLGSIFHDVIYVKSFLKDKLVSNNLGVSTMTEAYVCRLLLPLYKISERVINQDPFWQWHFRFVTKDMPEAVLLQDGKGYDKSKLLYNEMNLKTYNKYLTYLFNSYKKDPQTAGDNCLAWYRDCLDNDREKDRVKEKAILALYRFIIYLTYRSNGTPKKLSRLFEDHVTLSIGNKNENYIFTVVKEGDNKTPRYFLRFKFNSQYKFGLIHSIFRPFLLSNGRYLKALGDKQLVSTSFLLDYIFKFHSIAFTYRNFELTPELIAFNKSPGLRNFIENLIQFLNALHVREVQNGLYQFKFNKRTSQEISYLSKISEVESAAFNFSLDESLMVKRHYNRKVKELNKHFSSQQSEHQNHEFIYSVGFANEILGDLHYYDQEFDDAIIYYSNTIQQLHRVQIGEIKKDSEKRPSNLLPLILLIRVRLKMSMTLEKMKSFATAYTSLLELCDRINLVSENWNDVMGKGNYSTLPEFAETTRLLVQPYILKLFMSEKGSYGSLALREVLLSVKCIEQLAGKCNTASPGSQYSSYIMMANCYRDIGTLLYYKNCTLYDDVSDNAMPVEKKYIDYKMTMDCIQWPELTHTDYRIPRSALVFYIQATNEITLLSNKILKVDAAANSPKSYKSILGLLNGNSSIFQPDSRGVIDQSGINSSLLSIAGDLMSNIGDCLLTCVSKNTGNDVHSLKETLNCIKAVKVCYAENKGTLDDNVINVFEPASTDYCSNTSVILHFYISGLLLRKGGKNAAYAAQLKKILYVIKGYYRLRLKDTEPQQAGETFETYRASVRECAVMIEEYIIADFLRSVSWSGGITDRLQILKYREIFGLHDSTKAGWTEISNVYSKSDEGQAKWLNEEETLSSIYNGLTSNAETQEVLCVYYDILMQSRLGFFTLKDTVINPTSVIDSQFVRVQQLNLKCKLNQYYLEKLQFKDHLDAMFDDFKEGCYKNGKRVAVMEYDFWKNNKFFEKRGKGIYLTWEIKDLCHMLGTDELMLQLENFLHNTGFAESLTAVKKDIKEGTILYVNQILERVNNNSEVDREFENFAKQILSLLISDSIFCMKEAIKTNRIFGQSHTINYSYLGHCHQKMGDWCLYYRLVRQDYQEFPDGKRLPNKLKQEIIELVGLNYVSYLEADHHYELAIQYYYKMQHVHSEGAEYYSFMNDMYYLEDDFNDSLDHFAAAMERRQINSEVMRAVIQGLKTDREKSYLFKVDRFYRERNMTNLGVDFNTIN